MNEYFMWGEATINGERLDFDIIVPATSASRARDVARDELNKIPGCTRHVVKSMQKV